MIKYVMLVSTLVCFSHSIRPPYGNLPNRNPVLPQYTTASSVASVPNLGNRIDSQNTDESNTGMKGPASIVTTTTRPVTQSYDEYYLAMIESLPRDQQPFWYINREHINAHLGLNNMAGATNQPQTPNGSFHAG